MSEIALLLGVGLGGIGLGTIIAAGYLYSNKDKEDLKNAAAGVTSSIATSITPNISISSSSQEETPEQKRARREKTAATETNVITKQRILQTQKALEEKQRQPEDDKKIAELEQLYTDIQRLDEELRPINEEMDNPSTSQQVKETLKERRSDILVQARKKEKKIKTYPEELRQKAKSKLSFKIDTILRQSNVPVLEPVAAPQEPVLESVAAPQEPALESVAAPQEPVLEPVAAPPQSDAAPPQSDAAPQEPAVEEDEEFKKYYGNEENEDEDRMSEDLNMPFDRSSSFSSVGSTPAGGSRKYFTLSYTPKKLTKKHESKYNTVNNAKSKRNIRNRTKTKRNNKKRSKRNKK